MATINGTNLGWLKQLRKADNELMVDKRIGPIKGIKAVMEYRKIKALEIIAEELIKHNETSKCIVTALENIDTTNRR